MITFEKLPEAVAEMRQTLAIIADQLNEIKSNQPINEPPINGTTLRERLGISKPTEIAMRRRGKLPFIMVNGHYRYDWQQVLKALQKVNNS